MKLSLIRILGTLLFCTYLNSFSQTVYEYNGLKTVLGIQTGAKDHISEEAVRFMPSYSFSPTSILNTMHAYTTQSITEDVSIPGSRHSTPEFDNHTIDTELPVGYTPGQATMTLTGAATYNIPIFTPKGTNGLQPNISVFYNSQSGNGLLGQGWNLGGLSIISKVPNDLYHDGKKEAVELTLNDKFSLDGNRLLLKNGTYGLNGSIYATENETFSQITAHGTLGNGPEWFEVITKDGLKIEYGKSSNARLEGENTSTGRGALFWRANRISDQQGNYIDFEYAKDLRDSRISKIKYTGNSNTGLAPYNEIVFEYTTRADYNSSYIADSEIGTKFLLKKININSLGLTFKTYSFNYGFDKTSFLNEIIEGQAPGRNNLNSTIFKYGTNNTPFEKVSTIPVNSGGAFSSGDYNGDGITDIVNFTGGFQNGIAYHNQYNYYKSNGSNFILSTSQSLPTNTYQYRDHELPKSQNKISADFDGDGLDDILITSKQYHTLFQQMDKVAIMYSTGNSFTTQDYYSFGANNKAYPQTDMVLTGDFNGDGAMDFLTVGGKSYGSGSTAYIADREIKITYPKLNLTQNTYSIPSDQLMLAKEIKILDYNGDGKDDIMIIPDPDLTVSETKIYCPYSTNGFTMEYKKVFPTKWHTSFTGDFNGDGKDDVFATSTDNTYEWTVAISSGTDGFFHNIKYHLAQTYDPYNDALLTIDVNNDGKTDIVHQYTNSSNQDLIDIYYSNGSSFLNAERHTISGHIGCWGTPYCILSAGDYNGDGNLEIIGTGNVVSNSYILRFNTDTKYPLLTDIKDGFNNITSFDYTPISRLAEYVKGYSTDNNTLGFDEPLKVVKDMYTSNGNGGTTHISQSYSDGIYHTQDKGFLGFENITNINHSTNIKTVTNQQENTTFHFLYPKYNYSRYVPTNTLLSMHETDLEFIPRNNGGYFTKLLNEDINDYLKNSSRNSQFTYDVNGNIISSLVTQGDESILTTNTYVQKGSNSFLPNRLEKQTITATKGSDAPYTRNIDHEYDNSTGLMTKITTDIGTPLSVIKDYQYDVFGNIYREDVKPTGLNTISSLFDYDTRGRNLVKSTNHLGQTSEIWYNEAWCKPSKTRSIGNIYNYFKYDGFGRTIETKNSKYLQQNTSYSWSILENGSGDLSPITTTYKVETTGNGSPKKTLWLDALGRTVKGATEGLDETSYIVTKFNDKGQHISVTAPFFENAATTLLSTKSYDNYGRITSTFTGNIGSTVSYQTLADGYRVTTTKPGNIIESVTYDEAGKVKKATDAGGTLTFSYFSSGKPKEVKQGYTILTQMEYDLYGNQTKLIDANAGTTTYGYNALGKLISQTDANYYQHTMDYDDMGRIITRNGPEGTTQYEYYNSGDGINQIKRILGFNGFNEDYTYDKYGRLTELIETIDNQEFPTQYKYDYTDRVTQMIYPSGYVVNNIYDSRGFLVAVTDVNGKAFYDSPEYNASGQLTQYTLGNGITTEKTYDSYSRLTEAESGSIFYQKLLYKNNQSLIEHNTRPNKYFSEQYTYDNQQRLTGTNPVEIVNGDFIYKEKINTSYNNLGNIISKSDVGNYNYGTQKPHAVLSVSDVNNNNMSPNTQDITYTTFDRTKSISENGMAINFYYNASYDRKKSTFSVPPFYGRTRYYIGNYEKTSSSYGTNEVHYILGGDGICALHVIKNGIESTHYVYKDHLGSFNVVTDENGNIEAEQNYDAWGRERNSNNWTYSLSGGKPDWLYRGFTGHEMLAEFDLINMNNRMYDPLLGRMLAADNFVQAPLLTGSYNRFSYVGNNPVNRIDPKGEVWFVPVIVGAAIFGSTNLLIQGTNGEINSWKDGFNAFGGGALAGAALGLGIHYGLASSFAPLIKTLFWTQVGTTGVSVGLGSLKGILSGNWDKFGNSFKLLGGNFYLNSRSNMFNQALQGISRFTWELPQNVIGSNYTALMNAMSTYDDIQYFEGRTFSVNFGLSGHSGVSLGSFIDAGTERENFDLLNDPLLMHEYGHTPDSKLWGWFYLPFIGIPSATGAEWTEKRANKYAKKHFGDNYGVDWDRFEHDYETK